MSSASQVKKRGHICPPSTAKHPSDRWETMFVYSFICRFTQLRGKIECLETPMDLENALLSHEPNPILTRILGQFILNLRPQTRNLSTDQISATVASVLSEYFKSPERTIFWNDDLRMNVDPFEGLEGGFFATDWDFKLKILRQLVELQLCHNPDIKTIIDRAWGVTHNKHKKKDPSTAPPDSDDPNSQEKLQLLPLGQDSHRKRFWVADDSPRIYVSTNPWKTAATFQTVASTREEYIATIENLKASAPPEAKHGERRTKLEQSHLNLITLLENRIEAIDAELARVQKVRKKIEARNALLAQAEIRETRTRRQTQRPDYVYSNGPDSEDDADEYVYQEDEEYDDQFGEDDYLNFRSDVPNGSRSRRSGAVPARRSTRTAALNINGKREADANQIEWRGERRSSRLGGGPADTLEVAPPPKRARTEESTTSTNSAHAPSIGASAASHGESSGPKIKIPGAAAVKPTEIAMEQVAGRKKSKFWFYAVEPVPGALPADPTGPEREFSANDVEPGLNGRKRDEASDQNTNHGNGVDHERLSLSPAPSSDSV